MYGGKTIFQIVEGGACSKHALCQINSGKSSLRNLWWRDNISNSLGGARTKHALSPLRYLCLLDNISNRGGWGEHARSMLCVRLLAGNVH